MNLHSTAQEDIKKREEVADGLYLIDFEQLKIENQGNNEKIESKNEELLRLRNLTSSTVQVEHDSFFFFFQENKPFRF